MLNGISVPELIEKRYSCRSYDPTPIAEETRRRLSDYLAVEDAGPFGTKVRMQLLAATPEDQGALKRLGTYGFIAGATGYIVGAIAGADQTGPEDFGYVMERAVLFATSLGLGTVWLGGTFTKSRFAAAIDLQGGEVLPAVVATGYIAARPRGLDALIRRGARANQRLAWDRLFFDEALATPLAREDAGEVFTMVLEMVRRGPSASNKQPWRVVRAGTRWHFYMQRTRGYGRRNGIVSVADMQRIDLGIAMCHFALTTEDVGLSGSWVREDPAIGLPDGLTSYVASWVPV